DQPLQRRAAFGQQGPCQQAGCRGEAEGGDEDGSRRTYLLAMRCHIVPSVTHFGKEILTVPADDLPSQGIDRLRQIMARLRDRETGCPWDVVQDFSTIAPYTIEEAYEVAEAVRRDDMAEL